MSPRGRPKGESLNAKHEGTPVSHITALCTPANQAWLANWCAGLLGKHSGLQITPLAVAVGQPLALALNGAAPMSAVLLFVNDDLLAWARSMLVQLARQPKLLAANDAAVALVTRSLRPAALRELLEAGATEFFAWDDSADVIRLRLSRLATSAAARRKLAGAAEGQGAAGASRSRLSAVAAPQATAQAPQHPRLASLIGRSPNFLSQLERIPAMAGCGASVLILGETGTGKELCAQALHYMSPRAGHPCVAVNCGALPQELVESELFGHVRGAFTSAHESRSGLVAQAQGGTLFLDEVDSLPLAAQVKLLRFLQDKEYRAVGSARCLNADVRIVAASNGDLAAQCHRGSFRSDLFYRLNVLRLTLPPLRERGEDVLPLAQHFVQRFAFEFQRPVHGLSPCASQAILAHDWPGNVRELEHVVERGVLQATGDVVRATDLELPSAAHDSGRGGFQAAKARVIEQFERRYIEHLLAQCGGNITQAAAAAAKDRRAFFELMRKRGIDSSKYRDAPSGAAAPRG